MYIGKTKTATMFFFSKTFLVLQSVRETPLDGLVVGFSQCIWNGSPQASRPNTEEVPRT